ncbi:MAG: hypothetical protein AAB508_01815, partial [Patescibacteria group bacterium]
RFFTLPLNNCANESTSTAKTLFGKNTPSSQSITLIGTNSRPCIYGKLADILSQANFQKQNKNSSGIIHIHVEYKPQHNESFTLCLTGEGKIECNYVSDGEVSSTSLDGWQFREFFLPFKNNQIPDYWMKLELNADSEAENKGEFRNLSISHLSAPIYEQLITLPTQAQKNEILIPSETTLTVTLPTMTSAATHIEPAFLHSQAKNCYPMGDGTFKRSIMSDQYQSQYVQYQAHDASSCETLTFSNPLLRFGSAIFFTHKNMSGRPIKFCYKIDPPGYCLLEDILPENKSWSTASYIAPEISTTTSFRYYIELDNYAVGKENRINDLASIDVYPIPYSWLQSLKFTSNNSTHLSLTTNTSQNQLDSSNISVYHPNPSSYTITLPANSNNSNDTKILSLNQAYDERWKAYDISEKCKTRNFKCLAAELLPFLFGTEIKNHFLINNWANGWILPEAGMANKQIDKYTNNQMKDVTRKNPAKQDLAPQDEVTIILFFLPQLLEWMGFLLLPIPFLFLLRSRMDPAS